MPYIGNTPALDYISFAVQNFTVTAGTTVYTLDYSVSNENDIALYINSVAQRPGVSFAYSATGTTLTLTSATLATDTMYAVFIGRAVQTVVPPANINLQLADGTAAAPSLNFANDTNTGIFRPTTDEIALTEGGVEGMRLNASGNVQFAKNISIGGATPTTSGFGITFPGTQSASTNANTLDDYEEGTWTPILTATSPGASGQVYSSRDATYTKIGRYVYCTVDIRLSTKGTFSGSNILLGALPFTINTTSGTGGGSCPLWGNLSTNWNSVTLYAIANTTTMYITGAKSAVANTDFFASADISATTEFKFNFSFIVL
jgi:hypothetical protein